jgi:hypothetical protein
MLVTVTLQCSVLLTVNVTAVFSTPYGKFHSAVSSAPYDQYHFAVFSAPYGQCHSAVSSAPYGQCHSAVFSAPYGHCHSATYCRSAVVMNVPSPCTASRQSMQQPVTPAISKQCCTQDPAVNFSCH